MPRTKEQNEALRAATHKKILVAATLLFSEKGFSGTGVQEIADQAGISIGLLYRHFKTKDDIFGALATQAVQDLQTVGELLESNHPPLDIINGFINEVLKDMSKNEDFARFMELLSRPFISNQQYSWMEDMIKQNQLFEKQLSNVIIRGQNFGIFRLDNPTALAQFFLGNIQGMCSMQLSLKKDYVLPTHDMMINFLIKPD